MQPGQMIRSRRCCSWETLREFLAMESHKFGKSSPVYIRVIYSGRVKCFKCKLFFFYTRKFLRNFSMSAKVSMHSLVEKMPRMLKNVVHLFQRICKQRCKRKRLSCRIRLYTTFCRRHKIMT